MSKYKVLGVVNILISIFFLFILVTSAYSKSPVVSLATLIPGYAPQGIILFSLCMNGFIAYKLLLKKKPILPFKLYLILTFSTVFWFLLLFIGYFYASEVIFPIASLVLTIFMFYFLRKSSKKIAITLSIITLLVSFVVVISSFEEDYCWSKGTEADKTGSHMVVATRNDANALKGFGVKEGTQIGVSFRAHMLCHTTFNFTNAVKERYFLLR